MTVPVSLSSVTIAFEAAPGLGPVFAAVRDAVAATPPAHFALAAVGLLALLAVVLAFALGAARRSDRRPRPEMITRQRAEAAAARAPERGETR